MFGLGRPKGTRVCPLCHGSKSETYTATEPAGWGSSQTRQVQKTRTCSGCGGMGYVS